MIQQVHSVGRSSGGCLYGFRKSIQSFYNLKFENLNNNVFLSAIFGEKTFYIPRYINCTSWNSDFDIFENFLSDLKSSSFCIIGDLNARIGNSQKLDKNVTVDCPAISEYRNSKDAKIDPKGRRLLNLIENIGGIFINGRLTSDKDGNYTFCGGQGKSIIDYCICSVDFINCINNFEIPSKIFSDHMPLILHISDIGPNNCKIINLPPKIHWSKKNIPSYVNKLSNLSENSNIYENLSADENLEEINKIYISANNIRQKKYFDPKMPWFDSQCERARVDMLERLNYFRKNDVEFFKTLYVNARKKYNDICSRKKLEFYVNKFC